MKKPATYMVVRTDRIGDLVLSLPVAEAIKKHSTDSTVFYVVSPRTSEIARACPFIDGTIGYDETSKNPLELARLIGAIRHVRPDVAVFLRPSFGAVFGSMVAGVPRRVGTAYRYYAALFNTRVREHRRYAEKHESEYNLNVLRGVLDVEHASYQPLIAIDESRIAYARRVLAERGLRSKGFAILHPGSGRSARNLPLGTYAKVADMMEEDFGMPVLLTLGEGEAGLAGQIDADRKRPSTSLSDIPSPLDLGAIVREACLFVSGSTGPMHIAAAMGTPTLSFFSPVRSCSPRRWGPLGRRSVKVLPPVPQCPTCTGAKCPYYDCMDRIDLQQIRMAVVQALGQPSR